MQHHLATGALGVVAVLGTLALAVSHRPADPAQGLKGHLVLLVEGDARGLGITHITAKTEPYNPVHGPRTWSHEVVVYDRDSQELGRYPLDLSKFDLDPAHAGRPLRVEGCEVIDTRVVALANVPWLPNAAFLEIEKGAVPVGRLTAVDYARLVAAAEETGR